MSTTTRDDLPQLGFRLGDALVEPSLDRIVLDSREIHLEPRAMDLLVLLARSPGTVLSREAILDAVWEQHHVGEGVVRRAIAAIRRALGDSASDPRFIQTIPKRGYRLIATVADLDAAGGEPVGVPASPAGGPRPLGGTARCALLCGDDEIALDDGEHLLGRGDEATIAIRRPGVSRRHALLRVGPGGAVLEDLGSKNGTWVAGRRIEAGTSLADGDTIAIGSAVLVFRDFMGASTTTMPPDA